MTAGSGDDAGLHRGIDGGLDRFTLLCVLMYSALGISCAQFGIVGQPLRYYLMDGLGLDAAQIGIALSVLMLPWIAKPFYGIISDLVPLFGYRRKSYLVAANLIGAGAFLGVTMTTSSLSGVLIFLGANAVAMAVVTALMVAAAVEIGRDSGKVRHYVSVQELAFYAASVIVSTGAGLLCQSLQPEMALKTAALISVVPPICVSLLIVSLLQERQTCFNRRTVNNTTSQLLLALRSRSLWIVLVLTVCWTFSPALGVPLYVFESKSLAFSQATIGHLASCTSIGMIIGAVLSGLFVSKLDRMKQALLCGVLLPLSTLSYLLLSHPGGAIAIEIFRGASTLISTICLYGLAADFCPRGAEAAVMSVLVAVLNCTSNASNFFGGHLFTHVLDNFQTLVTISAVPTILSFFLLLCLPKPGGRQCEKMLNLSGIQTESGNTRLPPSFNEHSATGADLIQRADKKRSSQGSCFQGGNDAQSGT